MSSGGAYAGRARCRRAYLAAALFAAGLAAAALAALGRLPRETLPAQLPVLLHVDLSAPGLAAPVVDETLVLPFLEARLRSLPGVARWETVAVPGGARFELNLDDPRAAARLREVLQAPLAAPSDVHRAPWFDARVHMARTPPALAAEYTLVLRTDEPAVRRAWFESKLTPWLAALSELAPFTIEGAPGRSWRVEVDARRLTALGLSLDDVLAVLRAFQPPPASSLSAVTEALAAATLSLPGGERIALAEVARVALAEASETTVVREEGRAAVRLRWYADPPTARARIAAAIHDRLAWLRANQQIPQEGLDWHTRYEAHAEVKGVLQPLAGALAGAVLAVLLFVRFAPAARRLRASGRAAASLFAALAAALAVQAVSGGEIHAVLLGACGVSLGLFVVPVWLAGRGPRALRASWRIAGLTLFPPTAAFLAARLLDEVMAFYVRAWLLPVLAGWMAAVVMAALLPPPSATQSAQQGRWGRPERLFRHRTVHAVGFATVVILVASALVTLLVRPVVSASRLPGLSERGVFLRIEADTLAAALALERRVRAGLLTPGGVPRTYYVLERTPFAPAPWTGHMWVEADDRQAHVVARSIEAWLDHDPIPGLYADVSPGRGEAVPSWRMRLYGPDPARLAELAEALAGRLAALPAWRAVRHDLRPRPQSVLHLDRDRVALLGLDVARVARVLAAATAEEGIVIEHASLGQDAAGPLVFLLFMPGERERLPLLGETRDRPAVYLRDVAEIEQRTLPGRLRRANGERFVEIAADLRTGQSLPAGITQARKLIEAFPLPPGFRLEWDAASPQYGLAAGIAALAAALVLSALGAGLVQRSWKAVSLGAGLTVAAIGVAGGLLVALGEPLSPPFWAAALLGAVLGPAFAAAVAGVPSADGTLGLGWMLAPVCSAVVFSFLAHGPAWPVIQPYVLTLIVVFACLAIFPVFRPVRAWHGTNSGAAASFPHLGHRPDV